MYSYSDDSNLAQMLQFCIFSGAFMVSSQDLRQAGAGGVGAGIWSSSAALQTVPKVRIKKCKTVGNQTLVYCLWSWDFYYDLSILLST